MVTFIQELNFPLLFFELLEKKHLKQSIPLLICFHGAKIHQLKF